MPEWRLTRLKGEFCVTWDDRTADGATIRRRYRLDTQDRREAEARAAARYAELTRPEGTTVKALWEGYQKDKAGKVVLDTMQHTWKALEPFFGHLSSIERNASSGFPSAQIGHATLYQADCFDWLAAQPPASIHAVVTDPPYGLVEYTAKETAKLRAGNKGGIWRVPPSFDGHQRAPLPRFTVLTDSDRRELYNFFKRLGLLLSRVAVPGANIVVASNPLLAHIVGGAMSESGLELRGYLARQVMTMRGGDRPKNAHEEFEDVSVMPRSQWEPWVILRTPLDGRVQDNLRRWKTGGFRRPSKDRPFGDLIRSHPTPTLEKKIAPHPSLKPQAFMRQVVRAVLPMSEGVILDPFMGGGSTLAAANAVGYESIGVELDKHFFNMAKMSIPRLTDLAVKDADGAISSST